MTAVRREDREILRQLNDNELEDLLKLYEEKCGTESFQYLLIYTQWKWNMKLKEMGIDEEDKKWISFRKQFYTNRNGDFRRYASRYCRLHLQLFHLNPQMQSVSLHSWEPNFNELLECLNKTHLIQWKNGPLFINVAPEYSDAVKRIALQKGTTIQRARRCNGFILSHGDALHFKHAILPDEYRLEQLREEHVDLIHSLWANKKEASLDFLKGLIKVNKSIGIYEKKSDQIVGWIFQNEFSGLGILEVLPLAQRKGFGTILAKTLSRLIAETECINISAWAVVENMKSESLLQKVGFRKLVTYEWIQLNKNTEN